MPDISIITINYNQSVLTKNFVDSVIKYTPLTVTYEIIIVDNCSRPKDFQNLKKVLENFDVKIIRSNINTGFGGGNMLGVEHADGNYLAFINNDVLFIEDSFSPLLKFMNEDESIGVIAPQQLDRNLQPAYSFDYDHGIRRTLFGNWANSLCKNHKRERKLYHESFEVDFIQGCFMFFKKKAFNAVKGFDTNLFLYYEEMDICYRLKQIEFSCYFSPITKFIHLEGESTEKSYQIKKELNLSRLYVSRKHHNAFKYSIIRLYFLIKWFFKSLFNTKYFDLVFIILRGDYVENSLRQKQAYEQ